MYRPTHFLSSLAGLLTVISSALAGDLNPPGGAVAPTMKDLQTVEPRKPIRQSDIPLTISSSGSYYLTENLLPVGLGDPFIIEIVVNDVAIDLRGFTIQGSTEVTSAIDGIFVAIGISGIWIHSGTISDCLGDGVNAIDSSEVVLGRLTAKGNAGDGLRTGDNALVEHCVVEDSGNIGIRVRDNSVVQGCAVRVSGNTGIRFGANCIVDSCTSESSQESGFRLDALGASLIVNCIARDNRNFGFILDFEGGIIQNCIARSNPNAGIVVQGSSYISGNLIMLSGPGPGILVNGIGNRVESNNVLRGSGAGIVVNSSSNFVVRNTCRGNNPNWDVAPGNAVGVVVVAPLSPAFIGNSGGIGVGTTDPWANFSY